MNDLFYRAFEDRHRGSRDLIKDRLRAYEPFLQALTTTFDAPQALDLGCGRGEWLELLGEQGFKARGVDLDEGMLAACRERGLDVATLDALTSLRAQPDASLALVSGFHLVEHIDFDDVQTLIVEALRVLQPGGLLIMETPNPENLVVATSGFYMDPSHVRPIPSQLLEFVVEFHGFGRHRVVRLQEPKQLAGSAHLDLINVLDAVSPDYSVVAQKAAPEALAHVFDAAFSANFGLTLVALAQRYDAERNDAQQALRHDIYVLGERILTLENGSAEVFRQTIATIHDAHTGNQALQQEVDQLRKRERDVEEQAHRVALAAAENRIAVLVGQQAAAAQQLHAMEQRALNAEQAVQRSSQDVETVALVYARKAQERVEQELQEVSQRVVVAEQRAVAAEQRTADAEERAASARNSTQHLHDEIARLQAQLHEVRSYSDGVARQIAAMYASSSWRMTKPARAAMTLLQRARARTASVSSPVAVPALPAAVAIAPPPPAAPPAIANTSPAPAMSPQAERVFQQLLRSAQDGKETR